MSQRGNILFLILLAVVLFAALSYAVTSSTQGGGKNGGDESAAALASQILNKFAEVDTAVQRMMLTEGVKDYELNFQKSAARTNLTVYGQYDNTNCTETRCRVYDPEGGNVTNYTIPPIGNSANSNPFRVRTFLYTVPGAKTSLPDLIFVVYGIRTDLCRKINAMAGLGDINSVSISETTANFLYYFTPYPAGPFPDTTSTFTNLPQHVGSTASTFCINGSATIGFESYFYPALVHVVLAR